MIECIRNKDKYQSSKAAATGINVTPKSRCKESSKKKRRIGVTSVISESEDEETLREAIAKDIILNSLRLRSTAIKKALSSSDGTVTTLKYADIKNLSKWSQYLIRIIIEDLTHCPFDINASSCPEDLSPLEYAVLLGETRIANLLLKEGDGARVTLKSLRLSITDQDRELINDMLRHLSTDHLSNTDQLVQLGSLHCCLSEQSCDIYENIVAID